MKLVELKQYITTNAFETVLEKCYGHNMFDQKTRYQKLLERFENTFNQQDVALFSTSGRSEICGNHTDHQLGSVIAAGVTMDMIALAAKTDGPIVVNSTGFSIQPVDWHDLSVNPNEYYTSEALIRGIVARFEALGYQYGGFHCVIDSAVLKGSGISSSAAFEVLIATILNHLYNDGAISLIEIAQISQYSENHYFNKPSGLMDQMACALGGMVYIDFKDQNNLIVEKIDFDLATHGYQLCLVDTGGDHAHLSDEYGLIYQEMCDVAHYFQQTVLSQVAEADFMASLAALRKQVSDRAILRSYHFFNENHRVLRLKDALNQQDMLQVLAIIRQSGDSSYKFLQNIYASQHPQQQGIALALALADSILQPDEVARVHGGGLAGTIQAFVKDDNVAYFKTKMEQLFGDNHCHVLNIRNLGSTCLVK